LIIYLLIVLRDQQAGRITPFFMATPTSTRTVDSFVQEAEVDFVAVTAKTLQAFENAAAVDPNKVDLWWNLPRKGLFHHTADFQPGKV
jgi:hypothetical protein